MEEEALRHRIETVAELKSLVHVMRTLAAARTREYEEAVTSIESFGRTIASGLQVLVKQRRREFAVPSGRLDHFGAIVVGSDQGLSGNFNERIAEFAIEKRTELDAAAESWTMVVVGERPATYLESAGYDIEARLPFVGERGAITTVILTLLKQIEEWQVHRGIDRILMLYNKPAEASSFQPTMQTLLPLDTTWLQRLAEQDWTGRSIPTFTEDWDTLFSGLVNHHIFFTIYRALIESLASENSSRLRAMQAAQRNIDERLDELHFAYHRLRQASITGELLDILTGYEAVAGDDVKL